MKKLAHRAFLLAALSPVPLLGSTGTYDPVKEGEIPAAKLKVDMHLRNFNQWDREKLAQAKSVLETVMNSPQFKKRVLGFTFKGERRFNENNGMSNKEIFEHLMTGAEDLMPEHDQTMNFDLTLYRSLNPWSKVKGYTEPDSMRIYLNKKYYRRVSWTIIDVAANLAHEWVHKMGFGHEYYDNEERPFTVPYGIGRIVEETATSMGL